MHVTERAESMAASRRVRWGTYALCSSRTKRSTSRGVSGSASYASRESERAPLPVAHYAVIIEPDPGFVCAAVPEADSVAVHAGGISGAVQHYLRILATMGPHPPQGLHRPSPDRLAPRARHDGTQFLPGSGPFCALQGANGVERVLLWHDQTKCG